ncbi:MAG: 4Fe-4S binding protein [Candidatus Lokiarchaeota archaeon]|nr:4Fe-4S binding protein [Candidatus Lokiarchaeota archaeon]
MSYKAVTILEKCQFCGTCVKYCPLEIRKFNSEKKAITIKPNKSCGGCLVYFHPLIRGHTVLKTLPSSSNNSD